MPDGKVTLLVSTRKGAFFLRSDAARKAWKLSDPAFLGNIVNHMVQDPRDRKKLVVAAKTGHLGPTVFRSADGGKTWKEAARPPQFPKAKDAEKAPAVDSVFFLTPGHASQPGVWYAGTVPFGLFRSEDHGATWEPVKGYNESPMYEKWIGFGGSPAGSITHSILIDPRDANHMYVSMSLAGFFESNDAGATWKPLNKGSVADFFPDKHPDMGQDPHCAVMHPADPDVFYQQNHCGIYRMDRREGVWHRIGDNMPKKVGDIGFAVVAHPRQVDTAWVFPMDGTEVWPRTPPMGKPGVFITKNGGKTWKKQCKGMPAKHAYWTVFRQAMCTDTHKKVGLYFGTTSGEVWGSTNEGESWKSLAAHLPAVLAVETAV